MGGVGQTKASRPEPANSGKAKGALRRAPDAEEREMPNGALRRALDAEDREMPNGA